MHNVLKRIRMLSNDTADRLLEALGLTVSSPVKNARNSAGFDAGPLAGMR